MRLNPKTSVYFVDRRFFRGVSLAGTAEILEDTATKARIWRDGDEQYYSQGVTDPDYCVIKVTVQKIRYYSNFKSTDYAEPFILGCPKRPHEQPRVNDCGHVLIWRETILDGRSPYTTALRGRGIHRPANPDT